MSGFSSNAEHLEARRKERVTMKHCYSTQQQNLYDVARAEKAVQHRREMEYLNRLERGECFSQTKQLVRKAMVDPVFVDK
ncbi:DgyrCDS7141 [Dimorphilus gyrociliatus]|uniref:DgyrCDS7141 n=1 Tax=Dimorphilus gyrociliatus TaxID=2664684 RepID=A0A7I8VRX5_9ANNE|nr:DgyrCDS7141 [Dimorphilus gyrociliatus]